MRALDPDLIGALTAVLLHCDLNIDDVLAGGVA